MSHFAHKGKQGVAGLVASALRMVLDAVVANPGLAALASCSVGVLAGLGFYSFLYAEGFSYLGSDPKTCVNCHIMREQFDSWQKSSHHHVAGCVDCHLPHDFAGKYIAKAENGYHHSKAFTLQNFHEPIMIKKKNSAILSKNCITCHGDIAGSMMIKPVSGVRQADCVHCHMTVGHGDVFGMGGNYKKRELRDE